MCLKDALRILAMVANSCSDYRNSRSFYIRTISTPVAVITLLLLTSCNPRSDPGLREALRKEGAVSGLALADSLGPQAAVLAFDGTDRYFRTDSREARVFSSSGRMLMWSFRPDFLSPAEFIIETIAGDQVVRMRQPATEFIPAALNENASRIAFWGTPIGNVGLRGLHWASFDLSKRGFVDETDGHCDWSPDGSALVYEKQGQIYIFEAIGGSSRRLAQGHDPTWSTNGQFIAYRGDDDTALVMTTDGAPLTSPINSHHAVSSIRWSPDCRYVSFAEEVSLHVPLIGTYHRLIVCRISDGKAITVRSFGLEANDYGNFHWIAGYQRFCADCSPGEAFN